MHIGPSTVNDYVEIGKQYYAGGYGGWFPFSEANIYPHYNVDHEYYQRGAVIDFCPGYCFPNVYLNVTPYTGFSYTYKTQFAVTQEGYAWHTHKVLPFAFYYNYGINLSEVSKYGSGQGQIDAYALRYRSSTGGWYAWTHLSCPYLTTPNYSYANNMYDWDAVRDNMTEWHTRSGRPPAGDC